MSSDTVPKTRITTELAATPRVLPVGYLGDRA
jgi:hypothetical protein